MKFIVHLASRPADTAVEHSRDYQACLAMCQQLGAQLPRRPVESGGASYLDSAMLRFGQVDPEAFQEGAVLVLADLAPLGTIMVPILKELARRGVTVYAASLGHQPLLAHLAVIEATAAVFTPLVRENVRLRKELASVEARWKATYDESVSAGLIHAIKEAVPALVSRLPTFGEPAGKGEATPKHIGQLISHERERQGLTSTQLGQITGVTQPTIARLEAGEITAGPARDACMRALFLNRAKMVEDRLAVAKVVEQHGGGPTSAAQIIS